MKKLVIAALVGMLSIPAFADQTREDYIAAAKDMMSFEDAYVAETAKMAANHAADTRAHYIQAAKDMMSFEDAYVAETAKMAANQKVAAKSKGKKSAEPKQEELHIDP